MTHTPRTRADHSQGEAEICRSHMLIVSEKCLEGRLLVGSCEGSGVSLTLFSIFSCNEEPSTK